MPKRSTLPKSRRHILIYDEDWDFITRYYGRGSAANLTISNVIRSIIHRQVHHLRSLQQNAIDNNRAED